MTDPWRRIHQFFRSSRLPLRCVFGFIDTRCAKPIKWTRINISLFFSPRPNFFPTEFHITQYHETRPFHFLISNLGISDLADYDRGQYHICPCRFRGYTCINTKETRKVIRFESIRNRFGFFCSIIVLKGRQRPDRRPRDRPQLVSTGSPMTHTRKIPDTEPISRLSFTRPR